MIQRWICTAHVFLYHEQHSDGTLTLKGSTSKVDFTAGMFVRKDSIELPATAKADTRRAKRVTVDNEMRRVIIIRNL